MSLEDAMKIEREYLATPDTTHFYFTERMELAGYKDLAKYHAEKKEYLFNNSKIQVIPSTPDMVFQNIQKIIDGDGEALFYFSPDKPSVYVGSDGYNKAYCDANDIQVYKLFYVGCTSVTTPKDLSFVFALKNRDMDAVIMRRLVEYFKGLGVDAAIECNDITVKGNKIIGSVKREYKNYFIYLFQAIFQPDANLTSSVNEKMDRPTQSINDFTKITREDLFEEIKSWL
jgi:hypothetical protein